VKMTELFQFVWYRKNTKRDEERRKLDSRPLLNKPYRKDVRRVCIWCDGQLLNFNF
jgi:hypothetical protein